MKIQDIKCLEGQTFNKVFIEGNILVFEQEDRVFFLKSAAEDSVWLNRFTNIDELNLLQDTPILSVKMRYIEERDLKNPDFSWIKWTYNFIEFETEKGLIDILFSGEGEEDFNPIICLFEVSNEEKDLLLEKEKKELEELPF